MTEIKEVRHIDEVFNLLDKLDPEWQIFPMYLWKAHLNLDDYLFAIDGEYANGELICTNLGRAFFFCDGKWLKTVKTTALATYGRFH